MEFKSLWDLDSALQVLSSPTVDSKIWAEAVEWLMLYGPKEIRSMLIEASTTATSSSFPELKPTHFTSDGQPCYDIGALAKSLGIKEEEARAILQRKEAEHQSLQFIAEDDNGNVH